MHPVNVMLRCIVRALYQTEHVVIVELLIRYKRLTAREMADHLRLPQVELSKKCDDLCSEFLISSQIHEASGKPRYYIDFKTAMFAVGARLKGDREDFRREKGPHGRTGHGVSKLRSQIGYEQALLPSWRGRLCMPQMQQDVRARLNARFLRRGGCSHNPGRPEFLFPSFKGGRRSIQGRVPR
ncbi:hypothetical protein X797_011221 [Metarhizium robertsii]|uniref:Uncharacterized protein n=1 Tax=Metarhizium robertsii TaxID=568076 RepID=A0A0A1UMK1_9HYPO|nr:hypothetical protein X797_011221 [Metarhizium robertsii]